MSNIKEYLELSFPEKKLEGGEPMNNQNQVARLSPQPNKTEPSLRNTFFTYSRRCLLKSLIVVNIWITIWVALVYTIFPEAYNQGIFALVLAAKRKPCYIPQLKPFSEEIYAVMQHPAPIDCAAANSNIQKLAFTTDRKSRLIQILDMGIPCCYRPFERISDTEVWLPNIKDNKYVCYNISGNGTEIPTKHEFIEIICSNGRTDYRDGFAFIPKKPDTEKRIEEFQKSQKEPHNERLSVLIFGLDSTSHMNFQRMMPRSYEYLVKELSAIPMNGYTKVGGNTLPNVVPLLTGLNLDEFKEACVRKDQDPGYLHLDDCPFLWKQFAAQGYRTSFAEDDVHTTIFNLYWSNAFKNPPTDYYLRTFSSRMQASQGSFGKFCYGPKMSFKVLLDNVEHMAEAFKNQSYFQFSWGTTLGHDDPFKTALGDGPLLSTLKFLKRNGHLNNTVLVLISDHGSRITQLARTRQGQIEDRMPLAYFVLPEWFSSRFPEAVKNLKANSNRLTTPFDVHATVNDLINISQLEYVRRWPGFRYPERERGSSLFRELADNRGCSEAGIPPHSCVCYQKTPISLDVQMVKDAVSFVIDSLNRLLRPYRHKCATLRLYKITDALKWEQEEEEKNEPEDQYESDPKDTDLKHFITLQVSFETYMGKAAFETTVLRQNAAYGENWVLPGEVVRTNRYEGQSNCVEQDMKPFCFCI